jgi:C4-dicarboxylate-binding protein DctP
MTPKSIAQFLAASIIFAANPAFAEEIQIKFPTEYSMNIAPGLANEEFARLVTTASGGDISVKFYPSGSLYKGVDLLQGVLRGDVQMSTLVSPFWTAASSKLSVLELPYAFPTHQSFRNAAEDKAFVAGVFSEIEEKGGVVLGLLPYDYLVPGTRDKALISPGDFSGQRMRSLGRSNLAILEALGAVPVSLNLTELSPALQQGLIDGLNGPIDIYLTYKWYEHIKHITMANYSTIFYPWVVNKQWWDELSDEHKVIIQEAADTAIANHWQRLADLRSSSIDELRALGVEIHEPSDAEIEAWRDITAHVWESFAQNGGSELINALKEARN